MRRREFITFLGGAATTATWPRSARAQQPAMQVIGLLSGQLPDISASHVEAFRRGLSEAGFVEGRNVTFEPRWADNNYDRLPTLAADLVERRVALIAAIAYGGLPSAMAAKAATTTIPIVFLTGADPVKAGLVASLNRPGGNVTGAIFFADGLGSKRLGLLHELLPQATEIAVLINPNALDATDQLKDVQGAARTRGLQIHVFNASTDSEIDASFAALVGQRADALWVGADPFFSSRHDRFVALAARHAVPAIYDNSVYTTAGGLISYATNSFEAHRMAGVYAGRILKGEKPSDLPVLQPIKFELVINLRTAKALGLTVPASLLAVADEVIE